MLEAVLFDGDQTLWDFQKVMRAALVAVLDELRRSRPAAATLQIRDLASDRAAVATELAGVEYNLARLRALGFARTLQRLREAGSGASVGEDAALAEELTASYFRHRDRDPALFDDTLPCLDGLHATYRLGLLSNGSRLPSVAGLDGYFEAVVFAQDHQAAKPDPAIFAVMEERMGVRPQECVLVGDHPLNDVGGAKRSGWRAVWIDRDGAGDYVAPDGCTEVPDATISSLDQLADVLAALNGSG